jgi:hypothetical protein
VVAGLDFNGAAKPDQLSGTKNWVKASWLSPFFVPCFYSEDPKGLASSRQT